METMKAAVIYEAGGPEVLKIEERPIPTPKAVLPLVVAMVMFALPAALSSNSSLGALCEL